MSLVYKSKGISWVSGGVDSWPTEFVPSTGPRGGRVVVDYLLIQSNLNYTTATGVSMSAPALASSLKEVRVFDPGGNRRKLKGVHLRAIALAELGENAPADPAIISSASTSTARTFNHLVFFGSPKKHLRRWDFAIPADHLKGGRGGIEISMPAGSDLVATGGTPTINSGTYTCFAFCREEFDLQVHSRDEWRYVSPSSATEAYIPINDALIRYMFAFKASDIAAGGTDMSSCTTIQCEALDMHNIDLDVLRIGYTNETDQEPASTTDPWMQTTEQILPVVWPRRNGKLFDYRRIQDQLRVRFNDHTVTGYDVVYQTITERTSRTNEPEIELAVKKGGGDVVIKTAGKTARNPEQHGAMAKYLPAKIRVPLK